VMAGGAEAVRTQVRFGRTSTSTITIQEGLSEGDQVITTDMGAWDAHNRVRLR